MDIAGHWLKLNGQAIVYETDGTDPAVSIILYRAEKLFLKFVSFGLDLVDAFFKVFLFFLKGSITVAYFIYMPFRKINQLLFHSSSPTHITRSQEPDPFRSRG